MADTPKDAPDVYDAAARITLSCIEQYVAGFGPVPTREQIANCYRRDWVPRAEAEAMADELKHWFASEFSNLHWNAPKAPGIVVARRVLEERNQRGKDS
jgi:hypothetical protein